MHFLNLDYHLNYNMYIYQNYVILDPNKEHINISYFTKRIANGVLSNGLLFTILSKTFLNKVAAARNMGRL